LPVARAKGLSVIVTDAQGQPMRGGNHQIYQPVTFVVARPEVQDAVVEAIRGIICPAFHAADVIGSSVASEA